MGEPWQGQNMMPATSLLFFQGQTKNGPVEFSYKSEENYFDGEIF